MPDDLRDLMKRRAAQKADAGLQRMRSLTARMETVDGAVTHAIPLDWIVADATIQVRVDGLDMDRVAMYAEQLRQGAEFPPVDLFREGDTYYLGDGFHRYAAHQEAGAESILAIIHPGGLDAAFEHAEAANLDHGLSLTNDDCSGGWTVGYGIRTRRSARSGGCLGWRTQPSDGGWMSTPEWCKKAVVQMHH